jgi:hypothetical protein
VNSGLVSSCCASRSGERGTEERALVEGRRPGFDEAAAFDEAAVEEEPNGSQRKLSRKAGLSGAVAAKDVRGRATCSRAADKAAHERHGAGELSIEALVPVPRGVRRRRRSGFGPGCASRVVARPKLEVRRQAKLHLVPGTERGVVARLRGAKGAGSGIGQHSGCSCRESVAEVGEAHLFRRRGEARGNPWRAGYGGIARSELPAFDEAGGARGGR